MRESPLPSGSNVGYGPEDLTAREKYMAADPEMYRDELREMARDPSKRGGPVDGIPVPNDAMQQALDNPLDADKILASLGDLNQQARFMMVRLDPLLRKLPYEQRTAVLLNLLVTYAAEEPAALQARGKFINAMVEEFKKRLQMFLPLNMGGGR